VTERGGDLLDETMLRRALRLEVDERAPLFDPAHIAAAARQRPRLAIVSALVALAIGVLGAVTVWSAVAIFLPTVVGTVFDAGLAILVLLAVPASGTLELVQQPAVPLSLLVALAIAIAHELRERRLSVASVR
jgi:hypothetical protein